MNEALEGSPGPDPPRVTMADVARAAGTSTAVVSYVLNPGSRPVSDALRERVVAAIDQLDYRPDRHARALRLRRGWGQVGFVVPDVTLPLYGALVSQLEAAGRTRQQLVITGSTSFDPVIEMELVNALLDCDVAALLAASVLDPQQIARLSARARTPLLWVHNTPDPVGLPLIGSNHVAAGRIAAEHLLKVHQREKVAFIGGFEERDAPTGDREAVRDRFSGYAALYGSNAVHVPTDLTLEGAYHAVRATLAEQPDIESLIVGTYGQSPAVLRAVIDAGVQIPDELVLITFDGDPPNSYAPISLTTVQQDVELIARTALDLALGVTDLAPAKPFPVFLNIGESCGCRRDS